MNAKVVELLDSLNTVIFGLRYHQEFIFNELKLGPNSNIFSRIPHPFQSIVLSILSEFNFNCRRFKDYVDIEEKYLRLSKEQRLSMSFNEQILFDVFRRYFLGFLDGFSHRHCSLIGLSALPLNDFYKNCEYWRKRVIPPINWNELK